MFPSSKPWLGTYLHHNISPFPLRILLRIDPNTMTPFHLEGFVHNAKVRCVLIDGGIGLNIYTLNVVKGLGYSEEDVDPSYRITIKSYDDGEHFSKGIKILPIIIGPTTVNTLF